MKRTIPKWIIALLLGLAAAFLLWTVAGLIYESGRVDRDSVHVPIEDFSLNIAAIDGYLRLHDPDDCGSKMLTEASLIATVQNQRMLNGSLQLVYYQYLNELREGGSISTVTFFIDSVSGHITRIERYHGAGKGILVYDMPISDKITDFPLQWYVENCAALGEMSPGHSCKLFLKCTKWGIDVHIADAAPGGSTLYRECAFDWDRSTNGEGRKLRPLE